MILKYLKQPLALRAMLWRLGLALLLASVGFPAASPVNAAVAPRSENLDVVGWYVDTVDDDGNLTACTSAPDDCSLRGAINKANSRSGADSITLPAGIYRLAGDPNEDKNKGGDLDISPEGGSLTIYGEDTMRTVISGAGSDRIFHVLDKGYPATLSLYHMTIQDGYPGTLGDGGGLKIYSSLALSDVAVLNNTGKNGGGIYIYAGLGATLTIENSTIDGNTALNDGGGIYLWGGRGTVANSTLSNNKAMKRGGGAFNNESLDLNAVTVAFNNALEGGGVANFAFAGDITRLNVNNSTFSNNTNAIASIATGVENPSTYAVVTVSNSILANSSDGDNCVVIESKQGNAEFIDGHNNLDSGITCGFATANGSIFGRDPMLGALQDNGGPTNTMELRAGSPAINAASPATCLHRDQRGLASVAVCDMGAFESEAKPSFSASIATTAPIVDGARFGYVLKVWVSNAYGNPLRDWRVGFDSPDGRDVTLSANYAQTDRNGLAQVTASTLDASGIPQVIIASASSQSVKFGITNQGASILSNSSQAYLLPNSGFAPGVTTRIGEQPAARAFDAQSDMRLVIPTLGVDMALVGVPLVDGTWDIDWLQDQAGHLEGTAFPTHAGNSVVTGHVTLSNGKDGPFAGLKRLAWGDKVIVRAWGQDYVFEVRSTELVSPAALDVLENKEDLPWLTLLTCQGYDEARGQYQQRLVVRAVLVETR